MKKLISLKSSNDLLKHTGTIHIINSLSLIERKIYNILLNNAYLLIQNKVEHSINLNKIKDLIGRSGNKYEDIKKAIKNLVKTSIEWNILGADNKNEWGITTFLAGAEIKKNLCTYDYSSSLIKFLANPSIYARLNLIIQREFNNKHALVLWEFLHEQLCINKKTSFVTKYISLLNIRNILGTIDEYSDFKIFNRDVLKKAVKEINSLSDIEVETFLKKEGRKVTAISFSIKRKESFKNDNLILNKAVQKNVDKSAITNYVEVDQNIEQVLIKEFRISEAKAIKLVAEYKVENIEKSLDYVREQIKQNQKLINIAAYTVKAIKEGWMHTESYQDQNNSKNRKTKEEQVAEIEEYLEQIEDEIKSEVWWKVWMSLKDEVNDIFEFRNWLSHLRYENENTDTEANVKTIKLHVHDNSFIQQELKSKYENQILKIWQSYDTQVKKIEINLKKS